MKRTFGISDIQDEEDIYGRLVLNQKKRLKKKKADRPTTLAEKVRLVEQRRSQAIEREKEETETEEPSADEDLPVFVENEERTQENIASLVEESKAIRDRYEELELHYLFDDLITNFRFRLYVTAMSYQQQNKFHFDESELFNRTLRNVVSQQRAKKRMTQKFVTKNTFTNTSFKRIESDEIERVTMEIRVPRRIIELLES